MSGEISINPGKTFAADEVVTLSKLNQLGRPTARVETGAIGTRELADGGVTADKLADGVANQLAASLTLGNNAITTNMLANEAVTLDKMADWDGITSISSSTLDIADGLVFNYNSADPIFISTINNKAHAVGKIVTIHCAGAGYLVLDGTLFPDGVLREVDTNDIILITPLYPTGPYWAVVRKWDNSMNDFIETD